MQVSALLNYVIEDPVASIHTVADITGFVQNQGYDILRRVCGKFHFKTKMNGEPSLMEDSSAISQHMTELMAARIKIAGIKVLRMDFIELQYRSEVTTAMLQVQRAQARIDARA